MKAVEQVEARDIRVGDVLVNMGEVTSVYGHDDCFVIEWLGPWRGFIGANSINGRTFDASASLYRFKREGENPNRYAKDN